MPRNQIKTFIKYDVLPGEFIERVNPKLLNPDINNPDRPTSVKGVVYDMRWLPVSGVFLGRALVGPVNVHAGLTIAKDLGLPIVDLPSRLSHEKGMICATANSQGPVELLESVDGLRDGQEQRVDYTYGIVSAMSRRLGAITLATARDGEVLSRSEPTTGLLSKGSYMPLDKMNIVSTWQPEPKTLVEMRNIDSSPL